MTRIDLLISNPGHHPAMLLPAARRLAADPGWRCRVLSLCALRGFETPRDAIAAAGCECVELAPARVRRSPAAGGTPQAGAAGRRLLRAVAWGLLLRPRLSRAWAEAPALVVVPNDAAYPYDRIARLLSRRRIPFLLVQEGVRFPLPGVDPGAAYGRGGAAAIAAWGEASVAHFRRQGVPDDRLHAVGSPRFDGVTRDAYAAEAREVARRLGLGERNLLVLTNPIDDQGFTTRQAKLELTRRVVEGAAQLDDPGLAVVVKLHAREGEEPYRRALGGLERRVRLAIVGAEPLYPLLVAADAALVMASTTGLEALLLGTRLGVVEIPGVGFVHDYVARGAALGVRLGHPVGPQLRALLAGEGAFDRRAESYLDEHLAVRDDAAGRLAELIRSLAAAARRA